MEDLKIKYKSEVAMVAQQIELLEKSQEEEQMEIMKNLEAIRQEGVKYKSLLESERTKCQELARELEDSKHRYSTLESEVSFLNKELALARNSAQGVDQLRTERKQLEEQISDLQNEIQEVLMVEKLRKEELERIKMDYEKEKEVKNEINLKLQELSRRNESLVMKLQETESDLETALNRKRNLENELEDVKNRVKQFEEETKRREELQNEDTSHIQLEKEVSLLTQEIHTLTTTIANLEQYKLECHSLKERIINLVKVLRQREMYGNTEVMQEPFDAEEEVSDHVSLLEEHITFISNRLNQSQSLVTELHTVLQQNGLSKEVDKLSSCIQQSGKEKQMMTEVSQCSQEPIESAGNNLENNRTPHNQDGGVDTFSIGCQTCPVPTQEQGFQTSGLVNSPESVFASKTIEEDYVMEEIFVVPTSRVALRGSLSLKDLNEIGVTSSKDSSVSSKASTFLMENFAGKMPSQAVVDYEHLKARFYESQFMIKSLENENSCLKRALHLKNKVYSAEKSSSDEKESPTEEFVKNQMNLDIARQDGIQSEDAITQTDSELSSVDSATELRRNLLDTLAEKLDLLEKGENHLRKIELLQQEISQLRRRHRREEKPSKKSKARKASSSAAHADDRESCSKRAARHLGAKLKERRTVNVDGRPSSESSEEGVSWGAEDGKSLAGEGEEGTPSIAELRQVRENIWATKLKIQMQITESLEEELKVRNCYFLIRKTIDFWDVM